MTLETYTTYAYLLLRLRNFVEKEIFDSGFFHRPAYNELHDLITKIDTELQFVLDGIKIFRGTLNDNRVEFVDEFLKYVSALEKSTFLLERIVGKLKLKADGQEYRWAEYNKDVKEYEEVVAEYMKLGEGVNELGRIHNRLPREFLNALEHEINNLVEQKKISVEAVNNFKNSIFSSSN